MNNITLVNVVTIGNYIEIKIKVKNISYKKHVYIRASFDEWRTSIDYDAKYIESPNDKHDIFTCKLPIKNFIKFAICYKVSNMEYWNNNGENFYAGLRYDNNMTKLKPIPETKITKTITIYSALNNI